MSKKTPLTKGNCKGRKIGNYLLPNPLTISPPTKANAATIAVITFCSLMRFSIDFFPSRKPRPYCPLLIK